MKDERVDSRPPRTLDESLLAGEVISGQTSVDRLEIFQKAAKASRFSLTVVLGDRNVRRAVDPRYEDESKPINLIRRREPFVESFRVNSGNFGYYIGKPERATNHGAFWDAVRRRESRSTRRRNTPSL